MHAKCDVWLFLDKCAIVGNVFAVWMVYFCVFIRNRLPNMRAITTWMLFRGITSQCANRDLVEGNIFFSQRLCTMQTKRLFHKSKQAWCFLYFHFKNHMLSPLLVMPNGFMDCLYQWIVCFHRAFIWKSIFDVYLDFEKQFEVVPIECFPNNCKST